MHCFLVVQVQKNNIIVMIDGALLKFHNDFPHGIKGPKLLQKM